MGFLDDHNLDRGFDHKKHWNEYVIWYGIHHRCKSRNSTKFSDYGGRGIIVAQRWNSFDKFLADLGPRPSLKHSIDRLDGNGNYSPDNCYWATPKQQNRNKRFYHPCKHPFWPSKQETSGATLLLKVLNFLPEQQPQTKTTS